MATDDYSLFLYRLYLPDAGFALQFSLCSRMQGSSVVMSFIVVINKFMLCLKIIVRKMLY
jgi:hypothetical protein